jgi:hypothetical protein
VKWGGPAQACVEEDERLYDDLRAELLLAANSAGGRELAIGERASEVTLCRWQWWHHEGAVAATVLAIDFKGP